MDPVQRFAAYAAAFEQAYAGDDWSVLEPFFTEDAVYETLADPPFAARHAGRDAVMASLRDSVNGLDRRFDTRELESLEGPTLRDGNVWMRWRVTYRVEGAPPLVIDGEETAQLEGDRIARLEDRFSESAQKNMLEFMAAHAGALKSAP